MWYHSPKDSKGDKISMSNTKWLFYRFRAMSFPEIIWRLSQHRIFKKEKKIFFPEPVLVTEKLFNKSLEHLVINEKRLSLNLSNQNFSLLNSISLLGDYEYEKYKKSWFGGFQTEKEWPKDFIDSFEYKQRDDIGDARTNWELNRHFQFALLAKNYYASKNNDYLTELEVLFSDWKNTNPFLFGISWVSVMEVAIRASNWCFAYCFIKEAGGVFKELLEELRIGIINMTDYVVNHYSRYSSANNHLIVEAFIIAQSGILLDYKPWLDLGLSLLTRELPLQNYPDGVNKELSLHYQSFYMEAMALTIRLLIKNGHEIPNSWIPKLEKMSEYMTDCRGHYGEYIEFGDNDEGKILDLTGGIWSHYNYILGFMSFLLPTRYIDITSIENNENLTWLFTPDEFEEMSKKPAYNPQRNSCYRWGGVSILRSKDKQVLIGIDHGELGFGSIAAHGHADALSFQMFLQGKPFILDPGTYIYHTDIESRNEFRKTQNHNTVTIENRDQSEMLGAFLWGKRAKCRLLDYHETEDKIILTAGHDGYAPEIHQRLFDYNGFDILILTDSFKKNTNKELNIVFNPIAKIITEANTKTLKIVMDEKEVALLDFKADSDFSLTITKTPVSFRYGLKCEAPKISLNTKGRKIVTTIKLNLERND